MSRLRLRAGEVAASGWTTLTGAAASSRFWAKGTVPNGSRCRRCRRGDHGIPMAGRPRHRRGAQRVRPHPRTARALTTGGVTMVVSTPRSALVWTGCTPTGCGIPPPPRCCTRAARWPRSGKCGTARRSRQRSTRRATTTRSPCPRPALVDRCCRWCRDWDAAGGLADHLALRRALGYRLARPEKLLGQFLDTSTGSANRGSLCRRHWTGRVTHRRRARVTAVGRVGLEPTTQGL